MKIVAAHPGPSFSVHDVHVGWCEALRQLGNPVAEYNLSERLTFYDSAMIELPDKKLRKALSSEQAKQLAYNGLYSTLYRLQPDLLFVTSAFFYPIELFDVVRSRGTKIVLVHTESPYEDKRQLEIAAHVDINLVNDPCNLEKFKDVGPSYYVPHSYRPSLHKPGTAVDPKLNADLSFVGTGYESRVRFFESMDLEGLDVLLAGNWQLLKDDSHLLQYVANDPDQCLDNEQTTEVYQSARCGLNLYRKESEEEHRNDPGFACGPREIEMAACGLFFLREPRPEGDKLFPGLPTFSTAGEASELLRWWLARDDKRQEEALKARESIKDRTFLNRATELMQLLEKGVTQIG